MSDKLATSYGPSHAHLDPHADVHYNNYYGNPPILGSVTSESTRFNWRDRRQSLAKRNASARATGRTHPKRVPPKYVSLEPWDAFYEEVNAYQDRLALCFVACSSY